jgi:hypothetical protein
VTATRQAVERDGRISPRVAARVAWSAWVAWALLAGLTILVQIPTTEGSSIAWVPAALGQGSFMTVGAVVVSRQPHNRIGWLCCAAGLLGGLAAFSTEYAHSALGPQGGSRPGGLAMAWLNAWVGTLWAGLVLSFVLLLFPTGRLPSRRWRPVAWAGAVCVTVLCLQQAVMPGPLEASGQPNPLGIDSARTALEWIYGLVTLCFVVLMLLCAGSVVVRFRRAGGVERQQLKWFAAGAGQLAVLLALALGLPGLWNRWVPLPVGDLVFGISFALIPVTIGIAILRYRLYDIDRLINRTLVYGLLTAILGLCYVAGSLVFVLVAGAGTPPSWLVAAATLVAAAVFRPARRRIQAAVDRRFNRRKYHAATTIQVFSTRLRDQIDLDTLSNELLAVVDQTMEPTRVSLWLRPSPPGSSGTARSEARPTTWAY